MHPLRPRARFGRTARRLLAATAAVGAAALLIPAAASATVALAEKGTLATATGSTITPTLTTATTAGDLLVAAIEDVNGDCANDTFTAPASWVMAAKVCRSTTGPVELWYLPNTAAGATSFAFGSGYSGANLIAQVSEWSGVEKTSPVDQIGTNNSTSASTTLSLSTAAALANANELAVTAFETATGLTSFTPGTGWTALDSDPSGGFDSNYEINPASGAVLSGAVTSSPSTAWGGVIATFFGGCTGGSLTFTPPSHRVVHRRHAEREDADHDGEPGARAERHDGQRLGLEPDRHLDDVQEQRQQDAADDRDAGHRRRRRRGLEHLPAADQRNRLPADAARGRDRADGREDLRRGGRHGPGRGDGDPHLHADGAPGHLQRRLHLDVDAEPGQRAVTGWRPAAGSYRRTP
jgi:hypothetical protein